MDMLETLVLRVRSLFGARGLERELDEELRFHIDMQTDAYVAAGLPPAEARRRALHDFGSVDRLTEECRDVRTGAWLHQLVRAVRLGARRLVREPSFALPAVATLALGVGALAAIFALADAVLLRPLPYEDAGRIVTLRHTQAGWGVADAGHHEGTYLHYREGARVFEAIGAYFDRELNITDDEAPERILAALVTHEVLGVLRVRPQLGRAFTAEDQGGRAVLLSHELWQRRFGGDPGVVGGTITINSVVREVIGVLPPRTDFPSPATQLLLGMQVEAEGVNLENLYLDVIARLQPGATVADAQADAERLTGTLADRYGQVARQQLVESQLAPRVMPLKERIVGDVRPALVLLLATSAFVLLIALANVSNLVLVRAEHQRRQLAVERALGASGGTVALRLVTEHALLAGAGAALGLLFAWIAVRSSVSLDAWQIPRLADASLSPRTVAVAALCALVTTVLLSLFAWTRAGRADVKAALGGSLQRVGVSRETRTLQRTLTAVQIALACALLVGSALMVQSVARLARVPLGFAAADVTVFDVALPVRQFRSYRAAAVFHDELRDRILGIPGVEAAGAISTLPLTPLPKWFEVQVTAPGVSPRGRGQPPASVRIATPEYFHAMGIPILSGRTFEPGDLRDDAAPVILSAAVARAVFGAADPVGRRVELGGEDPLGTLVVVGVAGDVRDAELTTAAALLVYVPSLGSGLFTDRPPLHFYPHEMTFVVRSALPLETLLPALRAALREQDPTLPLAFPRTLETMLETAMLRTRFTATLLTAAAVAALLLSIIGVYGVAAYFVTRRRPELALRMALGATPHQVTWLTLRQGAVIALLGLAAGIPVAAALTRLLASLLFEVSPRAPGVFAAAAAGVLIVALLASGLPALRGARTSPARALSD